MQLKKLTGALRDHIHFFIILPLLIVVMTWPTVVHVFDTQSFWLEYRNIDANMLFWDAWYFKLLISGQADFYYTNLLFHPTGVSLAFHNFSLPHMIVFAALQAVMPASNAFNLTFLLLSFVTAAAGYVYLNYLFRDKWVALFGSVVFGAGAFILTRPAHPNIAFIATIPLSLYYLHRGLLEHRLKLVLVAGVLIGMTAFIGMYSLVCLLLMLPAYLLYFAARRWKDRSYWRHVFALCLVLGGFLALRFYPMLIDPQGLSSALSKHANTERATDLLGYFVNTHHPVTKPILDSLFPINQFDRDWSNVVFLGYIPILLVVLALARSKVRHRLAPWLALFLPFFVLRLGSFLAINGVKYDNIVLPKYYLTQAFPHLFKPFWAADNFHAGTLFPFAVLVCFGLTTVLRSVPAKRRLIVILLLTGATAFEYYHSQLAYIMPKDRLKHIEWLRQEPDQESIHLINVPFGTRHFKVYGLYQTYNGYPHVAGRPTRTPTVAFDYIKDNLILQAWEVNRAVACLPGNRDEFIAAQQQLLADGFTHIILHRYWRSLAREAKAVFYLPAAYEDDSVSIYRVEDLHLNCASTAVLSTGLHQNLAGLYGNGLALPADSVSVLSIHSYAMTNGQLLDYYSALDQTSANVAPLRLDDLAGQQTLSPRLPVDDLDSALSAQDVILIAYDPRHTDPRTLDDYEKRVSQDFAACGVLAQSDSAVVSLHLRRGFPCALATSADQLGVRYDNDAILGNLIINENGTFLDLYFLWEQLPSNKHSVSIQFIGADGSKVYNQDFVLGDEAIAHHRIDLGPLTAGDYQVKMILYDFETRVSVPGATVSGGTRFERDFEISRLSID